MENVPDRLLEVEDKTQKYEEKNKLMRYVSQTDAYEFDLPHIDHTIGYVIKYELEQMPEVEYVGLKMPHPLE